MSDSDNDDISTNNYQSNVSINTSQNIHEVVIDDTSAPVKKKKPSKSVVLPDEATENAEVNDSEKPHKSSKGEKSKKEKKSKKDKKDKKEKKKEKEKKKKDHDNPEGNEIIEKDNEKEAYSRRRSSSKSRGKSAQSKRISSQVQLLSDHCFTLNDEAITNLVRYKLPSDPQIDYPEKIKKRDELIHHLQEALLVMSTDKQRFQTACVDIEMRLHEENEELKQHITIANTEIIDQEFLDELEREVETLEQQENNKDEEISKLTSSKNERERRITDISHEIVKIQYEKKDFQQYKTRSEAEILKLNEELKSIKNSFGRKTQELQSALQRFAEMQKRTEEREFNLEKSHHIVHSKINRLEEEKLDLQSQIENHMSDTQYLFSELAEMKEKLAETKEVLKEKQEQEEEARFRAQQIREALIVERELRARAELKQEEEKRERISACAQLLAMEAAFQQNMERIQQKQMGNVSEWEQKVEKLNGHIDRVVNENMRIKTRVSELNDEISQIKSNLDAARANTEKIDRIAKLQGELKQLDIQIKDRELKIEDDKKQFEEDLTKKEQFCEEKESLIQEGEKERRLLHNTIQELRGNVRVYARVRPFLPGEGTEKENEFESTLPDNVTAPTPTVEVKADGVSILIRKKDLTSGQILDEHSFSYDKAFPPTTQQEEVFKEVSEFVQSALDGFNVCLFSYGQTGSGKTHTMQGIGNGPQRGIIPRAMEQVAEYKKKLEKQGWEYQMQVSFLEIYNEKIKDLLAPESDSQAGRDNDLNIRLDKKGKIYVEFLTKIDVDPDNRDLIDSLMATAAKQRSVAKTDMNAQSSRSHSIFTLYLTGCNAKQGFQLEGQLNLCDLAGSERVEKSGATGQRFIETVNINKSLSSLSDVFLAIGDRRTHIPFRNSKLTYLLMPALSGDGKTLMMINISPAQYNYLESLSTLRFGLNVNQCELGKALKNIQEMNDEDDNASVAPSNQYSSRDNSNYNNDNSSVAPISTPSQTQAQKLSKTPSSRPSIRRK